MKCLLTFSVHIYLSSLLLGPQFARGNLKLSEVLCESKATILYRATAEGVRDKPIDVTVKALRGQYMCQFLFALLYALRQLVNLLASLSNYPITLPIIHSLCVSAETATEDELRLMYYEIDQLSYLEHPNLVSLLRVCSVEREHLTTHTHTKKQTKTT